MTKLTLNQNSRLTDALERDILESTLNERAPAKSIKRGVHAVGAAIGAFFSFLDEVHETMNQARAKSAYYAGSQW